VPGGRVPLPAQGVDGLEHRHVEAGLERMLCGDQTGRTRADDRDSRSFSQSHGLNETIDA
jgi:hypothetical protein